MEVGSWKLEAGSWKLVFVVWECAHACLRRRQGGLWAPGAPPRGAIPAQTTRLTWCHGSLGFASTPMLNLMSFFDCLLGEPCDTFWRLVRAKLVPKPSSKHLLLEKVVVQETISFTRVVDVFRLTWHPKTTQDHSKTASGLS